MFANLIFWLSLLVSLGIGFAYFRDLGDVIQMFVKVKRDNMIRFIRHEKKIVAVGLSAAALMVITHVVFQAGSAWVFWPALLLLVVFYVFPPVWVHLGLRNQQKTAKYVSVAEAARVIAPASPVVVIENNGKARAHPDGEIMRPHLTGNDDGLDGEDVVMTYCAVANLGIGYTPEIQGEKLELQVLAQHGNNLILRDKATNEPIQHIFGRRERDAGHGGPGMKAWPTFRMSFRGFQLAYPDGEVFLNEPSHNPLLKLLDLVTETMFASGIAAQHKYEAPVMDNMTHSDDRLPNKTYVWGVNEGEDAVCFTREFLVKHGNLVNSQVGGRHIVVAYDPLFESIGVYDNPTGTPITEIDFYGKSDQGQLQRVDMLKAGLFWHVWVEFFPQTDLNRTL